MIDTNEKRHLQNEAIRILGYVVSEWETDPLSVQGFDIRIVKEAKYVIDKLLEIRKIEYGV